MSNMNKVISIYDAKTNFSKLVKKARAGETIYVGAYGQPQAIIAPAPAKQPLNIGVWKYKYKPGDFKDRDVIGTDKDITTDFQSSINRSLP